MPYSISRSFEKPNTVCKISAQVDMYRDKNSNLNMPELLQVLK